MLLGVLVLVHELGHYLVGRWCGIAVEVFSIGFGPRIFGWTSRGTDYRLSWIPLGGYVKFAGAHPAEDVPEGLKGIAFRDASLKARAATIFAGPLANFLLAIVVYMVLGMAGIPHPPPVIGEVIDGSPAEQAGIRYGDKFVKIGEEEITTWRDLERIISQSADKPLNVSVLRGSETLQIPLTPGSVEVEAMSGKKEKIGRAGIALGRQPSVVTVVGPESPAHAAGLKTGDRVVAAIVDGAMQRIMCLADLGAAALVAHTKGQSLDLRVVTAAPPSTSEGKKLAETPTGPERGVVLPVSSATFTASGKPDADARILLRALGLRDSQLTVAEATETLKDVLHPRDVLLKFNGQDLRDLYHLREQLIANQSPTAALTIMRDFAISDVTVNLKGIEAQKPEGRVTIYTLPVLFWGQPEEPEPLIEIYENPVLALGYGLRETWAQTVSLVGNVASLFTGDIPLKALGGPMLIAKVAGDSAKRGWQTFLTSMALISINLGLLNLFPIPVLDGGQLVLMGAEGVRRRPLRESAVENFQKVGFAMILALVVLATYNDLSRFWKSMLESVVGVFQ